MNVGPWPCLQSFSIKHSSQLLFVWCYSAAVIIWEPSLASLPSASFPPFSLTPFPTLFSTFHPLSVCLLLTLLLSLLKATSWAYRTSSLTLFIFTLFSQNPIVICHRCLFSYVTKLIAATFMYIWSLFLSLYTSPSFYTFCTSYHYVPFGDYHNSPLPFWASSLPLTISTTFTLYLCLIIRYFPLTPLRNYPPFPSPLICLDSLYSSCTLRVCSDTLTPPSLSSFQLLPPFICIVQGSHISHLSQNLCISLSRTLAFQQLESHLPSLK